MRGDRSDVWSPISYVWLGQDEEHSKSTAKCQVSPICTNMPQTFKMSHELSGYLTLLMMLCVQKVLFIRSLVESNIIALIHDNQEDTMQCWLAPCLWIMDWPVSGPREGGACNAVTSDCQDWVNQWPMSSDHLAPGSLTSWIIHTETMTWLDLATWVYAAPGMESRNLDKTK